MAPQAAPLICEGKEDDEFWTQLGGENFLNESQFELQYALSLKVFFQSRIKLIFNLFFSVITSGKGVCNMESIDYEEEEMEKHLYHMKIEKDVFTGEEIIGFAQNSLLPESAWLLDAGIVIWVWIGTYAVSKSLKNYIEEAQIFLYTHPASRDRNTIISIIKQGNRRDSKFFKLKIFSCKQKFYFFIFFQAQNHQLLLGYLIIGIIIYLETIDLLEYHNQLFKSKIL